MPKPLNAEQIKIMLQAGKITGDTLTLLGKYIKPGITTLELDKIAEDYIRSCNAVPTFKGYNDFPSSLCISIDECVVHGLPSDRQLKEGEIVSIDCGATFNGYVGDSAVTYPVGEISEEKKRLLRITEESLFKGIEQAVDRGKVYDISRAVQQYCESNGYSLTRELTGHGVGRKMHLAPSVPNFVPPLLERRRMPNEKLYNGLGIAIEPMVHIGAKEVYTGDDKWSVITRDHTAAAHFEHTLIINGKEPIITTLRN
ncbi:MAG: type I methionyl aminopeptidase [Ignavibacteria bacterium]|nr:type I methionyl aminopeptidase [Ignavibacteria bacterium]